MNRRPYATAIKKSRTRPVLNLQALGIYIAAVAIFLIFGLLNPNFLTSGNLREIAVSASVSAIIGLGSRSSSSPGVSTSQSAGSHVSSES